MTSPLAVALGDPAGIGPEIVAKAWELRRSAAIPPFFAIGRPAAVKAVWNGPIEIIGSPADAEHCFPQALPMLQVGRPGVKITPGQPCLEGARNSLDALEMAVGLTRSGVAGALVTGPVSKTQLYSVGFTHPGQTEFIAERCGVSADTVAMMLVGPTLRTVPITSHLPYEEVPREISVERIVMKGRTVIRGLQRLFGIPRPHLAVAGLNPHAGENGALGREEIDVINPAIEKLREEDFEVTGPYPPDAMFHARMRQTYDAALCMYHDQALIPLKTLHFDEGVNMTLGIPIVRTAPDHGTAFAIAGRSAADPGAMIAALQVAASCAERFGQE